jgi:hypothetical protein
VTENRPYQTYLKSKSCGNLASFSLTDKRLIQDNAIGHQSNHPIS